MEYYLSVLKKYAVFTGRARRAEYWYFFLFNFIAAMILWAIDLAIKTNILYTLYLLAVMIPSIAVGVRRLHDTNRTGWWILISLVPLIGAIILIVFFVQDSQPGDNQYGANPKQEGGFPAPAPADGTPTGGAPADTPPGGAA